MQNGGTPVDRNSRYSRFARADAHFHDAILRIGGNNVMRQALSSQHVHLHIFRLMFHARVTAEALDEHERLLVAFRNGDPRRQLRQCATISSGPMTACFRLSNRPPGSGCGPANKRVGARVTQ
jgi:DNA-binding GntR family transcriptional regulator